MDGDHELIIQPRRREVSRDFLKDLEREIGNCPDVAFAHLPEVFVPGRQHRPELVLFVWLLPNSLRSLRMALNLVSEAVARVVADSEYLDVVVLNSAPELLDSVERAGCLLVERDTGERQRALLAAERKAVCDAPRRRWWWPF